MALFVRVDAYIAGRGDVQGSFVRTATSVRGCCALSVAQTRGCDGRGLGLFPTTMANSWTSLLKNGARRLPRTPQRQLRGLGQGPSLGISYGRTKARTAYNYKTVRLCSFHHNHTAMSDNPSFVLTGVENTKFEQRAVPKAGPGEVIVAIKKTGACVPLHKAWRANGG